MFGDLEDNSSLWKKVEPVMLKVLRNEEDIELIAKYLSNTNLLKKLYLESINRENLIHLKYFCAAVLQYKRLNSYECLFRINDVGDRFYIILKGRIGVFKPKKVKYSLNYKQIAKILIELKKNKETYILSKVIEANQEVLNSFYIKYQSFVEAKNKQGFDGKNNIDTLGGVSKDNEIRSNVAKIDTFVNKNSDIDNHNLMKSINNFDSNTDFNLANSNIIIPNKKQSDRVKNLKFSKNILNDEHKEKKDIGTKDRLMKGNEENSSCCNNSSLVENKDSSYFNHSSNNKLKSNINLSNYKTLQSDFSSIITSNYNNNSLKHNVINAKYKGNANNTGNKKDSILLKLEKNRIQNSNLNVLAYRPKNSQVFSSDFLSKIKEKCFNYNNNNKVVSFDTANNENNNKKTKTSMNLNHFDILNITATKQRRRDSNFNVVKLNNYSNNKDNKDNKNNKDNKDKRDNRLIKDVNVDMNNNNTENTNNKSDLLIEELETLRVHSATSRKSKINIINNNYNKSHCYVINNPSSNFNSNTTSNKNSSNQIKYANMNLNINNIRNSNLKISSNNNNKSVKIKENEGKSDKKVSINIDKDNSNGNNEEKRLIFEDSLDNDNNSYKSSEKTSNMRHKDKNSLSIASDIDICKNKIVDNKRHSNNTQSKTINTFNSSITHSPNNVIININDNINNNKTTTAYTLNSNIQRRERLFSVVNKRKKSKIDLDGNHYKFFNISNKESTRNIINIKKEDLLVMDDAEMTKKLKTNSKKNFSEVILNMKKNEKLNQLKNSSQLSLINVDNIDEENKNEKGNLTKEDSCQKLRKIDTIHSNNNEENISSSHSKISKKSLVENKDKEDKDVKDFDSSKKIKSMIRQRSIISTVSGVYNNFNNKSHESSMFERIDEVNLSKEISVFNRRRGSNASMISLKKKSTMILNTNKPTSLFNLIANHVKEKNEKQEKLDKHNKNESTNKKKKNKEKNNNNINSNRTNNNSNNSNSNRSNNSPYKYLRNNKRERTVSIFKNIHSNLGNINNHSINNKNSKTISTLFTNSNSGFKQVNNTNISNKLPQQHKKSAYFSFKNMFSKFSKSKKTNSMFNLSFMSNNKKRNQKFSLDVLDLIEFDEAILEKLDNKKETENNICNTITDSKIHNIEETFEFICYEYFKILEFKSGDYFGDMSLDNGGLRTATITSLEEETHLGAIELTFYKEYIQNEKIRTLTQEVNFLMQNYFFQSIKRIRFEKNYYSNFELIEYHKGDYLMHENKGIEYVYFLRKGELELTTKKNVFESFSLISKYMKWLVSNVGCELPDVYLQDMHLSNGRFGSQKDSNSFFSLNYTNSDGNNKGNKNNTNNKSNEKNDNASFSNENEEDKEFFNKNGHEKLKEIKKIFGKSSIYKEYLTNKKNIHYLKANLNYYFDIKEEELVNKTILVDDEIDINDRDNDHRLFNSMNKKNIFDINNEEEDYSKLKLKHELETMTKESMKYKLSGLLKGSNLFKDGENYYVSNHRGSDASRVINNDDFDDKRILSNNNEDNNVNTNDKKVTFVTSSINNGNNGSNVNNSNKINYIHTTNYNYFNYKKTVTNISTNPTSVTHTSSNTNNLVNNNSDSPALINQINLDNFNGTNNLNIINNMNNKLKHIYSSSVKADLGIKANNKVANSNKDKFINKQMKSIIQNTLNNDYLTTITHSYFNKSNKILKLVQPYCIGLNEILMSNSISEFNVIAASNEVKVYRIQKDLFLEMLKLEYFVEPASIIYLRQFMINLIIRLMDCFNKDCLYMNKMMKKNSIKNIVGGEDAKGYNMSYSNKINSHTNEYNNKKETEFESPKRYNNNSLNITSNLSSNGILNNIYSKDKEYLFYRNSNFNDINSQRTSNCNSNNNTGNLCKKKHDSNLISPLKLKMKANNIYNSNFSSFQISYNNTIFDTSENSFSNSSKNKNFIGLNTHKNNNFSQILSNNFNYEGDSSVFSSKKNISCLEKTNILHNTNNIIKSKKSKFINDNNKAHNNTNTNNHTNNNSSLLLINTTNFSSNLNTSNLNINNKITKPFFPPITCLKVYNFSLKTKPNLKKNTSNSLKKSLLDTEPGLGIATKTFFESIKSKFMKKLNNNSMNNTIKRNKKTRIFTLNTLVKTNSNIKTRFNINFNTNSIENDNKRKLNFHPSKSCILISSNKSNNHLINTNMNTMNNQDYIHMHNNHSNSKDINKKSSTIDFQNNYISNFKNQNTQSIDNSYNNTISNRVSKNKSNVTHNRVKLINSVSSNWSNDSLDKDCNKLVDINSIINIKDNKVFNNHESNNDLIKNIKFNCLSSAKLISFNNNQKNKERKDVYDRDNEYFTKLSQSSSLDSNLSRTNKKNNSNNNIQSHAYDYYNNSIKSIKSENNNNSENPSNNKKNNQHLTFYDKPKITIFTGTVANKKKSIIKLKKNNDNNSYSNAKIQALTNANTNTKDNFNSTYINSKSNQTHSKTSKTIKSNKIEKEGKNILLIEDNFTNSSNINFTQTDNNEDYDNICSNRNKANKSITSSIRIDNNKENKENKNLIIFNNETINTRNNITMHSKHINDSNNSSLNIKNQNRKNTEKKVINLKDFKNNHMKKIFRSLVKSQKILMDINNLKISSIIKNNNSIK